jgi:hypothetical protein
MVSRCKLSINVVIINKLKNADKLEPKGIVAGKGVDLSPFMGTKRYRRTEST